MSVELAVGLLAGVLLLIVYLIYKFAYAPYQLLKSCGIKGPTPTPFFGNYRELVKQNALDRDQELTEKYGSVVGFYIGKKPEIMITDLDILKQIMVKEFDNFADHSPFPNILAEGDHAKDLFSSRGEKWKSTRKILSPSFSASKLKMMLPLLKKTTDNLIEVVREKESSQQSFDVLKVYAAYTLETILATAFGRRIDIQRGESDQFSKSMEFILKGFVDGQFEKFILIHSHFPWLFSLMKFAFSRSEAGKAIAYIRNIALDLIKARRETGHSEKYKDILQLMIEASSEEGSDSEGAELPTECPAHRAAAKSKGVMTDEEVLANSFGFLFAGHETTSITLSYASYELALHPDVQEKLQSEIDAYFDDKPEATLYTAAQEMDYLDNVIQETLRLHPAALESDRYCKETTVINGVTIPKGVAIVVPISLLHHSPLYWKEPQRFDPDRFTAEERAKRPQLCHMPFGFGPRSCIGMRLALLETKIALIELLRRFTFIRAPETEVPLKIGVGLTVKPKNGIILKVINRS